MSVAETTKTILRAEGFSCPSCVGKIEKQVGRLDGVEDVTVKFASGRVEVDHDESQASVDDIVAAIASAHDGDIRVESAPGAGSIFILNIPLHPGSNTPEATNMLEASPGQESAQ